MAQSLGRKIAVRLGFGGMLDEWDTAAALMESETDACVLAAEEGGVIYANRAAKAFFGKKSPLQCVSDRLTDEESNFLAMAKLDAAVKNKAETAVELALRPFDGRADTTEWWRICVRQIGVGTLWRATDITARRSIDAVMRQELQELGEFLDVLPIGLYQTDSGGTIHFANRRLCEWLGWSNPRELKGMRLSDLLAGGKTPDLDGLWHGELSFRTRTGTFFSAFVSHAVYDENGETMLRAAVVRDAGFRQECEVAAKNAELGLSWLFEEAPVGIAFIDMENVISEANAALFQMFGCTRDEMLGDRLEGCFVAEDWAELENKIAKVKMGFISRAQSEVRLKTKQDKDRIAGVFITPMIAEDSDGLPDIAGVVLHFIDNTERRSLERQFSQAQKMQAVGQLAGGIAHDFNNLLTAILGSTDLLLQTHPPSNPDFDELMNIHNSATRAARLVGQLLAYSRKQPLKPQFLDVTDVFADLKHMLQRLLGSKINIKIEHGRNLGYILWDRNQFDQVFVNLAVNAHDAMPHGGSFTISTRVEKVSSVAHVGSEDVVPREYVIIDAADTGTGIPADVLPRIFEPFFTTKSGTSTSGTGLGLAVVHGNIRQAGGYIAVKSKPSEGTVFSIYLPRHTAEDVRRVNEETAKEADSLKKESGADENVSRFVRVKPFEPKSGDQLSFDFVSDKPALPPPLPLSEDLSGSGTILLVEDEDGVRAVMKRALKSKGYAVVDCTCAEEALEKIDAGQTFNLLITDMIMPGMDGVALSNEIRKRFPEGRILLISGFSEEAARGEIKDMPNFYFLEKPFSLRDLSEKVKQISGEGNG